MIESHVNKVNAQMDINGELHTVEFRPAETLLQVLRSSLSLTGAKPGCLNGDCGACTVMVDRVPFKSCIMLAIEAAGKKIITIEGLKNTPIQKAFIENFAFQCGYCTPGFIINCHALLINHPNPSKDIIGDWLESNICRCTCYQEIENAVQAVINEKVESENDEN
ncbi:(2Fe-2S)-binding protein [Bacillus methanolicus]|uniref:(2Fe-2S)-binding domain-containing protein n=1 Tax=Bacillus methanolicus (strain MGA3 / ATCC 53907) TaxID=796606 RepID=I3E980_BACMM|nr:(2Fe-2S)-binding protein [Bacillus methanolicus]AIE60306.1 (2Fe-2S)-binding domain-containing protein [Bacillus methanolicus MGA3]EIJ83051.1 putative carbon monoxide dehydrogenase small subunit [Bacillus methanolicus MGA3]